MPGGESLIAFYPKDAERQIGASAIPIRRGGHPALSFGTTPDEVYFTGVMPQAYAGGDIVVKLHWAAEAVTGTGGWDVTFERCNSAQSMDSSGLATAQAVTAASVPTTAGQVHVSSTTCTAGAAGTDSVAAGDLFRLRVRRATDTALGLLQLLAVELQEAAS